MSIYNRVLNPLSTPQSEALDPKQVKNEAGGFTYPVDDWGKLRRFLILGSEGGCYYNSERALTKENASAVLRCIKEDGERVVDEIASVSDGGRAMKQDPALFALALVLTYGDEDTLAHAEEKITRIIRIPDHLTKLVSIIKGNKLRGWGRRLRRILGTYYTNTPVERLALHAVKYPSRNGWSHADLLKTLHVGTKDGKRLDVLKYMRNGWETVGVNPPGENPEVDDKHLRVIWAAEKAKEVGLLAEQGKTPVMANRGIANYLIPDFGLPMECVPTNLRTKEVYEALLKSPDTGITWLLRNLANLTRVGVLTPGEWGNLELVCNRLTDAEAIKRGRLHPLSILVAERVYRQGRGDKSDNVWTPVQAVVDALNTAYHQAFAYVEPTGKRYVLGIDASYSMTAPIAGTGLRCCDAACALSMVTNKVEKQVVAVRFDTKLQPFMLPKHGQIDACVKALHEGWRVGGTDCALPIVYALQNKIPADVFVIYTDSQSWAGPIHPMAALKEYRRVMGIPARLAVVAMAANGHSIGDVDDAGVLDFAGFDTALPTLLSDFAMGRV